MNYTGVIALLLSLRREHPNAEVVTEHIRIDDGFAVFKATISIPGGGKATGHGSEYNGDLTDYIEQAENKAIGRALNALGYGTQVAEGDPAIAINQDEVPVVVAANQDPAPRTDVRPIAAEPDDADKRVSTRRDEQSAPAQSVAPTPMPSRTTAERRPSNPTPRPTPVEIGTARERPASTAPTPFPGQSTASSSQRASNTSTADESDQPPLEDYSWTAFWKWAREQGYESKGGIEAFIGRQMNNLSPLEVRQLIVAKRGGA